MDQFKIEGVYVNVIRRTILYLKSREERYNDHDTEALVLLMSLQNASV